MADEQAGSPQGQQPQGEQPVQDFDFDAWLGEQPEHVRKGYEGKTQGLHSALEKERDAAKGLSKELKRLTGLAEKGSESEKALGEMSTRLERAERERDFIRDASRPETGCSNPEAAFLVAQARDLFKRSGEPDWAEIKRVAPELFGTRKLATGNAGTGTQSPTPQTQSMNAFIRAASGRGS
jgi:hypothetical protein